MPVASALALALCLTGAPVDAARQEGADSAYLKAAPEEKPHTDPGRSPPATAAASASGSAPASGSAGFGFDRVDLLSEDPGTFLHFDAPMAGQNAQAFGLRFVEQVKVVFRLPLPAPGGRFYAGASLQSQSLTYEHPLWAEHGLYATGGVQTRLLLPRGATAGLAWRAGILRVGASLSAFSQASWARPNWQHWTLLPTLGIGLGPVTP